MKVCGLPRAGETSHVVTPEKSIFFTRKMTKNPGVFLLEGCFPQLSNYMATWITSPLLHANRPIISGRCVPLKYSPHRQKQGTVEQHWEAQNLFEGHFFGSNMTVSLAAMCCHCFDKSLTIQVLLVFPYVCLPRWVSWMFKSISPPTSLPLMPFDCH